MILEVANMTVAATRLAEFESAFVEARKVITQAAGCGQISLNRCVETPGRYLLLVEWTSIEHHMEGFRTSPLFQEWRRILGPYFTTPPMVEHYLVAG